jgi:hypothetical protein
LPQKNFKKSGSLRRIFLLTPTLMPASKVVLREKYYKSLKIKDLCQFLA